MDATLTIQVRVLGAQALGQLKQVERAVQQANAAGAGMGAGQAANAGAFSRGWAAAGASVGRTWAGIRRAWTDGTNTFNRTIRTLDRTGQSLRRSGQQITFGFTIPFALAAGAAMNWALDNERAMTQVQKVYGDHTYTTERVKAETEELAKTFELLSGIMGVNQKEVIDIGAAWAGTGLAGVDLAKATRATMEAMVLGEMDAEKATNSLISIMATWRTSTDDMGNGFSELTDAMAILNATENQTGARFADLVDVFDRAGGAARQAGMSMEELAALGASLVPATGSGAAAGNAIKSMVSRIMAPTQETLEVLNAIGIKTSDPSWMGATATQKIERMAKEFTNLDQATRNVVTSTVAGRWQLNRFDVMMADIASGNGMYAKSIRATLDPMQRQGTYLKELDAIMDSNPKKLDILVNVLKNNVSKAFIQFIPILLAVMAGLAKLAMWFNDLSPAWKNVIMLTAMFIAVLGPLNMIVGVLATSLKGVFVGLKFMGGIAAVTGRVMLGVGQAFIVVGRAITYVVLPQLRLLASMLWNATYAAVKFTVVGMASAGKAIWGFATNLAAATARIASNFLTIAVASTRTAAVTAAAWLGNAAKSMATFTLELGRQAAFIARYYLAIAISALDSAAITAATWAGVAWRGMVAFVTGLAAQAAFIIRYYVAIAAAALQSAGATIAAWATSATTGIVTAARSVALAAGAMIMSFIRTAAAAIASATATVVSWLLTAAPGIGAAAVAIIASLTAISLPMWAIVAIAAAVVVAVLALFNEDFRNGIWEAVQWIARAIWALPQTFGRALAALHRVVVKIVTKIWEALSYLNPFQRHSPSLVDNVKAGVSTILDEYSKLRGVSGVVRAAAAAHQAFQDAIAGRKGAIEAAETAEDRKAIASQAPEALPSFDNMVSLRSLLKQQLIPLSREIEAQRLKVVRLQAAYDALDKQVQDYERTLDTIQKKLDAVNEKIQEAEDVISKMASTGIVGMREMEDEIFANEMAQKRLRLAMMDLADAGQTIDDIQDRFAALNGEIELLTGERRGLWLAGAGSDILKTFDDQIDAVKKQRNELGKSASQIETMQKELDELARRAERMELEKSIRFDTQLRQIDQLANGLNELPFDQIIAEIEKQKGLLAQLRPEQEKLNAEVNYHKAILEEITARRDEIKRQLDVEADTLDRLETAYSDIEKLINDMTADMREFADEAKKAEDAVKGILDGVEGDYDLFGGTGNFDTDSLLADIEALNKELEKELEGIMDTMPNPFDMIGKWFDSFKATFKIGWGLLWDTVGAKIESFGITVATKVAGIVDGMKQKWEEFKDFIGTIFEKIAERLGVPIDKIKAILSWLNPWARHSPSMVDNITSGVDEIIEQFTRLVTLDGLLTPVFQAIGNIIGWVGGVMESTGRKATELKDTASTAFTLLGSTIKSVWDRTISLVFLAIRIGLLSVQSAFSTLWGVVVTIWNSIGTVIKNGWNLTIMPVLNAVIFFLTVALPVAWAMFQGAVSRTWDNIKGIVRGAANDMADFVVKGVNRAIDAINGMMGGIKKVGGAIGVSINLEPIGHINPPRFAKGGIPAVDDHGGLYSGVRAIVGEGSKVWPEYVIPTDPQYRGRATSLLEDAASRIGLFANGGKVGVARDTGVGVGDGGGAFDKVKDVMMGGVQAIQNIGRDAARLMFQPFKGAANLAADQIPMELARGAVRKSISMIEEWIDKSEPAIASGDPGSLAGWKGKPGSYKALIQYIQQSGVPHRVISTVRPGATTRGSGNTRASLHSMARAVDLASPGGGRSNDGLLAIYRAFLPVRNLLTELIYSGPGGSNPTNPITRADHYDHVHVGLAAGGRVGKRIHNFADGGTFVPHGGDGVLARIGEGMHDERVQIMPLRSSDSSGGGDTYIDIDNLVLPNITSPGDAQELLDNLKAIAS